MGINFQEQYRVIFARVGFPLSKRDQVSEAQIQEAENKLGIRLPEALRAYYLIAGREKILNHSFNRICLPSEWETHAGKLIFMEENQAVVVWGTAASRRPPPDPLVFQCPLVGGDLDKWYPERTRCSLFLKFMIHLQAAYGGGMPCTTSAPVTSDLSSRLKPNWSFGGEVNGMRVYSRNHQVACVTKWRDLGTKHAHWRIFAGATTKQGLSEIASDLGVQWDRL
jgi:hypothetical protein